MDGTEAQSSNSDGKRGGAVMGLTLAAGGWMSNLIVYLIQEFNVESINAAQISNIVNGCSNLFPVIGAIGIILLGLTATLDPLRPQPCDINGSSICTPPSGVQYAVLYAGLALSCIGSGGTRFTLATMGANQFDNPKDQAVFFNWYFVGVYAGSALSNAIVYVEDNVSWKLGYGVSAVLNFIGLASFLLGRRFYLRDKPQGSPFTGLARVVVATFHKRKVQLSSKIEDYYCGKDRITTLNIATVTKKRFRFLNRAALKTEGDVEPDGSIAKPWRICTIQQVEDLKTLVRIFPLWSSSIFLGTPIGIQASLTVLQALTINRHLGPHFQIPAGSILVVVLISTAISLTVIDRFLCPMWQKLTRSSPTPLQRIGLGHVLNVLSMATSALVEMKRLKIARAHHLQTRPGSIVPMSVLWLFPQLVLVGLGEAFHFPGQVALYYQEFPASLRSTSTAMIALIIGISFYLSTALIDLVRRATEWLPGNINEGRVDNVYWVVVVAGVVNFFYYMVCSSLYKYQNVEEGADESFSTDK
ncbi:hypothetical protein FH972_011384 [Carpinus fangiana]|uniref:Uncharacterized protein n=1 Tax=Carpinus fangiana TaxID=176857 RepID=A0A660KX87_9ROSI|nr:hypothetical protein FH972_011384 [Carpinus fangiana]